MTQDEYGNNLDPTAYVKRLPTIAQSLPAGARAFATDPDHYDFFSRRCVKDLLLDRVEFTDNGGEVDLLLGFRHNCWKHEEDLTIRYQGIRSFTLDLPENEPNWRLLREVVLDEILPAPGGCTHEIDCLAGTVLIACRDLEASWAEADCPDRNRSTT
ncbi:hypothetical protein [Micromonospora sonneratiae]|uniref:hypothetical protein n=1 Tax=Micromonospora sonneratiae TaxID=1184706 RepID=UPI00366BE5B6